MDNVPLENDSLAKLLSRLFLQGLQIRVLRPAPPVLIKCPERYHQGIIAQPNDEFEWHRSCRAHKEQASIWKALKDLMEGSDQNVNTLFGGQTVDTKHILVVRREPAVKWYFISGIWHRHTSTRITRKSFRYFPSNVLAATDDDIRTVQPLLHQPRVQLCQPLAFHVQADSASRMHFANHWNKLRVVHDVNNIASQPVCSAPNFRCIRNMVPSRREKRTRPVWLLLGGKEL